MNIEISHEWWKIRVYNEVAEFLRHFSLTRKRQLDILLTEDEVLFSQSTNSAHNCFSEMELAMNGR
jgi:hypothetical protein